MLQGRGAGRDAWTTPAGCCTRWSAARRASWDTALDLVAARFRATIAEHGPDAVAFYVSGQCLTEDYYVANKLMKGFIGSGNIDTNSRLCMASSVAGHKRAFGADVVPGVYEDWRRPTSSSSSAATRLVPPGAASAPAGGARPRAARKIVVIDPRRTATADGADLHLPLAPGSDVALFDGLLAHLRRHGRVDQAWVAAHTTGFDAALAAARETAPTLERVAAADRPRRRDDIARFYALFAATERTRHRLLARA